MSDFQSTTPSHRVTRFAAAFALACTLALPGAAALAAPLDVPSGSTGHSNPDTSAPALRLASVDNFRDVAGPGGGYPAAFGLHVEPGVFYRSNALTTSDTDAATLDTLGISAVYDLRTDPEVADKPDRFPPVPPMCGIPCCREI